MSGTSSGPRAGPKIPLGPFDLTGVLGKGGMGEVWAGVHRAHRLPVAVKVMTGEAAGDPEYRVAFRNEVRSVARLDHPFVVEVLDYGEVPAETERHQPDRLRAGSPYLIMERVDGGSLSSLAGRLAWRTLRATLLCLLDALAHAHARGVIHRDLKPSNILLGASGGAMKLTDFGLAHALERDAPAWDDALIAGTPAYMAPEQCQSRWRDYGPWTDLYAFGCLAYALASGAPPFGNHRPLFEFVQAHLREPPPALVPRRPVPAGFEAWVRSLLEKDPDRRVRRAADAAWALVQLGDGDGAGEDRLPAAEEGDGAQELHTLVSAAVAMDGETYVRPGTGTVTAPGFPEAPGPATIRRRRHDATIPPVPEDWRRPTPPTRPPLDVGLGLYGLRSIPLVDRDEERSTLWQLLRRTREEGRARMVLLEGPAGCGKSRLAEWLCERAHETGAALVVKAVHSPIATSVDGIAAMLARHLRVAGLPRSEAMRRVDGALGRALRRPEALALLELLSPGGAAETTPGREQVRFAGAEERHAVARRFLGRLAEERPVIVWLDDVQWGADALEFARHVLAGQDDGPAPLLLVLTAREEAWSERAGEASLLRPLIAMPAAERLPIGPLPPRHRPALVRELLGLEGELAMRVEEKTAGNPLFAVQLVGDWVQRGILEPTGKGFRLRAGAEVELPDDLRQIWAVRIDRALAGRAERDGAALELAAVLGQDVDAAEWRDACGHAELPPPWELVELLVQRRLARIGEGGLEDGWSFVHGMLRESLARRAQEAGRFEAHHAACAAMLRTRFGPGVAERLGRHLLLAGRPEAALRPLLDGARVQLHSGDLRVAERLLADRERAAQLAGVPPEDPLWGEGWVVRSHCGREREEFGEARAWADRALAASRIHGWRGIAVAARLELGHAARLQGDFAGAATHLTEAMAEAEREGDRRRIGEVRWHLGDVVAELGRLEEARRHYEQGGAELRELGDTLGEAHCTRGVAWVDQQRGRFNDATAGFRRAQDLFERAGFRFGVVFSINDLAEVQRQRGDHAAAETLYREALARREELGRGGPNVWHVNLGYALAGQGRWRDARRLFEGVAAALESLGRRPHLAGSVLGLAICAGFDGDWPAFDASWDRAAALLQETGFVDVDIGWATRLAGDIACDGGHPERARAAWRLSRRLYRRLGLVARVAELEERIAALPPAPGA